jgi:hypothetical protein
VKTMVLLGLGSYPCVTVASCLFIFLPGIKMLIVVAGLLSIIILQKNKIVVEKVKCWFMFLPIKMA